MKEFAIAFVVLVLIFLFLKRRRTKLFPLGAKAIDIKYFDDYLDCKKELKITDYDTIHLIIKHLNRSSKTMVKMRLKYRIAVIYENHTLEADLCGRAMKFYDREGYDVGYWMSENINSLLDSLLTKE